MSHWPLQPFNTIYAESSRNGITRPKATRGSGYKMVNMGELFAYGRFWNPDMELVQLSNSEVERFSLKQGDLLFARQSLVLEGTGKCSIVMNVPEITCFESHLIRVRLDKQKVDPGFYYYYFGSRQGKANIQSLVMQVAAAGIRGSELALLHVPVPPLPTQRKISAILSAYDDLIENNLRRIKILEEMAQNLYREWFTYPFRGTGMPSPKPSPTGRGASGEGSSRRLVDSPLGPIPEGWEVAPFTEIADVLSGGTPKTTVQEYWGGSIPFFAPKDAPESFYVTNTEKAITEIGLRKCNSKLYPKNTVFITARGTVGKVVMPSMDMAMNQSCYALRGKQGISQLYLFLATREQVDYLKKNTGGATFDTIVVDTFRRMLVAKPGNEVIAQFAQLIQPGMELILNIIRKNTTLRRTRDLLLPRLISGEVDMSALDIAVPGEAA